jgi:DNA polymerase III subunit beta
LKVTCDTELFREAFGLAARVAPQRSPKPEIEGVRFEATEGGARLSATSHEIWIALPVVGVAVERPGAVLLGGKVMKKILGAIRADQFAVEVRESEATITAGRSRWTLQTQDPEAHGPYPEFPEAGPQVRISPPELRLAIRRTAFACDQQDKVSSRYAFGGCLFERAAEELVLTATEGHLLARQRVPATCPGKIKGPAPIVPLGALNVFLAALSDDPESEVRLAFDKNLVHLRSDGMLISARLLEGRFPDPDGLIHRNNPRKVRVAIADLKAALASADTVSDQDSRLVRFRFRSGELELASRRSEVGLAVAGLDVECNEEFTLGFNSRHWLGLPGVLPPDAVLEGEFPDQGRNAVLRYGDDFTFVIWTMDLSPEDR